MASRFRLVNNQMSFDPPEIRHSSRPSPPSNCLTPNDLPNRASYQAIEYCGPAIASLDLEDRLVLSNLTVEMGGKNGVFPADQKTFDYLRGGNGSPFEPVDSDSDARYSREIKIALDKLTPQIALPHLVDQVTDVREAAGTKVQMVYL